MNSITLTGRLTQDPELRALPTGSTRLSATPRRRRHGPRRPRRDRLHQRQRLRQRRRGRRARPHQGLARRRRRAPAVRRMGDRRRHQAATTTRSSATSSSSPPRAARTATSPPRSAPERRGGARVLSAGRQQGPRPSGRGPHGLPDSHKRDEQTATARRGARAVPRAARWTRTSGRAARDPLPPPRPPPADAPALAPGRTPRPAPRARSSSSPSTPTFTSAPRRAATATVAAPRSTVPGCSGQTSTSSTAPTLALGFPLLPAWSSPPAPPGTATSTGR